MRSLRSAEMLLSRCRPLRKSAIAGRALLLVAGIVFAVLPGFASNEVFDQRYPLTPGGNFLLQNVNGSVQIEGWNRDEVEVRAVKTAGNDTYGLDGVKIDVASNPENVAVRTDYPRGAGAQVAVDYQIHVPNRVLLGTIETVNGTVVVRGVRGGGVLRSVNGDIDVRESSGRFSAKTINGNLHVELRQLADGTPMILETVNGSVVLGLPANARANLKILNMNGDFYSELPVAAGPAARFFRAKLGAGGSEISVRTVNGGIRLLREPPAV